MPPTHPSGSICDLLPPNLQIGVLPSSKLDWFKGAFPKTFQPLTFPTMKWHPFQFPSGFFVYCWCVLLITKGIFSRARPRCTPNLLLVFWPTYVLPTVTESYKDLAIFLPLRFWLHRYSNIDGCWHSNSQWCSEPESPHSGHKLLSYGSCSSRSPMPFSSWRSNHSFSYKVLIFLTA